MKLENRFLLQALLYKEKGQFLQAKLALEKLQPPFVDIFIEALENSMTVE
ncbi:MAG: hypothetical protein JW808_05140 [Victivallales bacterium]|nr:hypothetical protein [Victivallales bacterium]